MSPFEIVYGYQPKAPIDLAPLPPVEPISLQGEERAEFIQRLHNKARENLEKRTEQYVKHANKGRKDISFEPGEWVWLHMRHERFPAQRSSKLAPRGDGPFKITEKINNNAYRLELPSEFNVSSSFNVTDLSPYVADDPVLRSKPLEEGGNDEDILSEPDLTEPDLQDINVPTAHEGVITRSRARILQHKFNQSIRQATLKVEQERAKEEMLMLGLQDQPVIESDQITLQDQPAIKANQVSLLDQPVSESNLWTNETGPDYWNQGEWPMISSKAQVQVFKIEWGETGA